MELSSLDVLVTGGAGFIGSNIVERLLDNGARSVRVLDNLSTGYLNNLSELLNRYENLSFVHGDITNLETCRKACDGMSVVCHQAALGSVPRSIADPLSSHNANVNGFLNVVLAAKENGVKRIVYASSSSVYGTNDKSIKIEEENGTPISPYAVTKYIDELYANVVTRTYGMEMIGLRYFNVFGPRQSPNGPYAAVIPRFIDSINRDISPTIFGDGSYSRDFTFVDNAVNANILALTTDNRSCFGEVFNVGCNNPVSVNELFNTISNLMRRRSVESMMGVPISPVYADNRAGDVPYSNASICKISEMLGYKPEVPFDEGIAITIRAFLE